MNSTFSRALVGFLVLTIGLFLMVWVALWSLDKYANGIWWGGLLVTAFGLASQLSIFMSTLWDPIREWIREPKLQAERDEDKAKEDRRYAAAEAEHRRKVEMKQAESQDPIAKRKARTKATLVSSPSNAG